MTTLRERELAEFQLSRLRGFTDPQAMHYWEVAAEVACQLLQAGHPTAIDVPRLHVLTVERLEVQAWREDQQRERADIWDAARAAAAVLYGEAAACDRDVIMGVLCSWAVADDEDRWVATIPQCDDACGTTRDAFSQIGHLPTCSRGKAWRARFAG